MEYRLARLICKYFNLSIIELDEEIEYGQYFCLLAEALDAQELEDYEKYMLAGGDTKKWKWRSPDQAGTKPIGETVRGVAKNLIDFGKKVFRFDPTAAKEKNIRNVEDYARRSGKELLLMNPDGVIFNQQVQIVDQLPKEYIIVKIDYDGNLV